MFSMCVKVCFFRKCLSLVFAKEKILYAVQIYMYSVQKLNKYVFIIFTRINVILYYIFPV